MKTLTLALTLALAYNLSAQEKFSVTLTIPIPVEKKVVEVVEVTELEILYFLVDLKKKVLEIEFDGLPRLIIPFSDLGTLPAEMQALIEPLLGKALSKYFTDQKKAADPSIVSPAAKVSR